MHLIARLPFLLCFLLTACGQPGPLYLPKDAPKVYDEPTPAEKAPDTKAKDKKAEPPPLPEKSNPTTGQ